MINTAHVAKNCKRGEMGDGRGPNNALHNALRDAIRAVSTSTVSGLRGLLEGRDTTLIWGLLSVPDASIRLLHLSIFQAFGLLEAPSRQRSSQKRHLHHKVLRHV